MMSRIMKGSTRDEIMSGYQVTREDIQATLADASNLADERHLLLEQKVA